VVIELKIFYIEKALALIGAVSFYFCLKIKDLANSRIKLQIEISSKGIK
jgi:hypothetical protein